MPFISKSGELRAYRAVKTIDKRRLPPNFDCSRELLVVVAILTKACVFTLKEPCSGLLPVRDSLVVV